MNEHLEQKIKSLPEAPGIYRMLDKWGNIIYIGKSKCLKKRVHSYFVPSPVWDKAKQMAPFIEDIEITVTDTHLEAMLLECESIKTMKPHFNSMMKNDQKYIFLTLEENHRRTPLKLTHIRETQSFGPFRSKSMLTDITETLRNLYPISKKGRNYLFEYHIFPTAMDQETFEANQKTIAKLLSSNAEMTCFLHSLECEMKNAAAEEKFERASQYRDLHTRLIWLQKYLSRFEEWHKTDLIYAVPLTRGYKFFYVSDGMILSQEKVPENTEHTRHAFAERLKALTETPERTEKELLDYRDIVYAELSGASEHIYPVN